MPATIDDPVILDEIGAAMKTARSGPVLIRMARLPHADGAILDLRKIEGYCLSTVHPRGRHKARVFATPLALAKMMPNGFGRLCSWAWARTKLLRLPRTTIWVAASALIFR